MRLLVRKALQKKPHVVALPENFFFRGSPRPLRHLAREVSPRVIREFQGWACQSRCAFLLGSLIEASKRYRHKFYNTSILISEKGKVVGRYRKIHLFENDLPNLRIEEAKHIVPGSEIVFGTIWGIRSGLTICYDLRFPELFRKLVFRGCRIFFVPSNFTYLTGKKHWEVLLRARAIENLSSVIAPAQVGVNPANGIRSFGRSLILNPWGEILAQGTKQGEEVIYADLDLKFQERLRQEFPSLRHRTLI